MSRSPTNTDILEAIDRINERLDRGDARFGAIDDKLQNLGGIMQAAATLETVAQTWTLASLGGRVVKWFATLAAGVGALWVFFKDGPQ